MVKRGESIVEVVVACGILSLVFTGVVTMITGGVKLNNDSRLRMEAVSLAQKELNTYIVSGINDSGVGGIDLDSGVCRLTTPAAPVPVETGYFYPISSIHTGCQVDYATAADLEGFLTAQGITPRLCQYIYVRELTDASDTPLPDETRGGVVESDKFLVVESHVKWVSGGIGLQEYIIRKLVRR